MENPSRWYTRKYIVFSGTTLIVIGAFVAIFLFSIAPIVSVSLFILIAGPGIFIGYRRKKARMMFFAAFWMISWGYGASSLLLHSARVTVANEFYPSLFFPAMILLAIVALPFACGRPWKTPNYSRFENTFFTYLIYLIIAAPFVFGFIWDYNIRGDTSPPETVGLRIERKYIDHNEMRTFYAEAPDGVLHFFLKPSQSLYDEHIEGDIIRITIHKGALGYMWIEDGYIPPPPEI